MTATPDQTLSIEPATALSDLPAGELPRSLVDVQRDALTSLGEEAGRLHRDRTKAEAAYRERVAWLDRRRDETMQRSQDRYLSRSKAAKARATAELEALNQSHDEERSRFERQASSQREDIASETRDQQKKATADLEYERWTAGSIFEGSLAKLKQWRKDQDNQEGSAQQRFWQVNREIQDLLVRFRMPDLAGELEGAPGGVSLEHQPSSPTSVRTNESSDAQPHSQPLSQPDFPEAFDRDQPHAWPERLIQKLADAKQLLGRMPVPRVFVGELPWVLATGLVIAGGVGGVFLPAQIGGTELGPPLRIMIAGCVALFVAIALWWLFFRFARLRVSRRLAEVRALHTEHEQAIQTLQIWADHEHARLLAQAREQRDAALQQAEATHGPVIEQLRQQRRQQLEHLDRQLGTGRDRLASQLEEYAAEVEKRIAAELEAREQRAVRRETITRQRHERDLAAASTQLETDVVEIDCHWTQRRDDALRCLADIQQRAIQEAPSWEDSIWGDFEPPTQPSALAPFGALRCRPKHLLNQADVQALGLPDELKLTASLSTPGSRSLLIEAEPQDRPIALSAMRNVILRLLTTQPPGQVRLTLLDPVGLGESFAALMHLADYDERLVNDRVWSEPPQMEQRLVDLTDHMSMVIQKYLRNDFQTIEAYNTQAGELAEPYRFLVMADFPHGLSDDGLARLVSIATSGARCGVFVILLRDTRQPLTHSISEDLHRECVTLRRERLNPGETAGWRIVDEVFGDFPLTLDQAPSDQLCTKLIHRIGSAAVDAERVQVPFDSITPSPERRWSADSSDELQVPIGRTGATRLQSFTLGQGVAQHALIAGKTGSGKSSLLHALVTNLALWYPPDQLELYLIDFKKGVEFKPYVTHRLPHARAIAIESDRAFGLSILRELDRLMDERGERFRDAGVQLLAQYRKARPDEPMPRVLLVVDEFQELFSRDDQLSQDAALLLDRVVRQGRAFGVHALMGSQSLSGAAGLARGTMGQMAVRIALQCNEADSQLILNDENAAARLLNRPGEAIYNARGGDLEGNSVFQVAWLPDDQHTEALRVIDGLRMERSLEPLPRAVFEGSAPALLEENPALQRMIHTPSDPPRVPLAFVGEPIAIEDPTAIRLPRDPGAHALLVGGSADAILPLFTASILSLAAQSRSDRARFLVLNGSSEPEHDDHFQRLADALPHEVTVASPRRAEEALLQTHAEMKRRLEESDYESQAIYLFVFGLQRFRDLRKQEDAFSFSSLDDDGDTAGSVAPDKALAELLRDGPTLGFHVIAWADRAVSVDAVFDRRDLREIDSRILFQMSANDSAQIMDSTDANELGSFRALLQREDRGTVTRFRPYGPIDRGWLEAACAKLRFV
ncbi:MAG: FtsK/SpoIIIE domain-containing protein [Planctomycetota bacterium]